MLLVAVSLLLSLLLLLLLLMMMMLLLGARSLAGVRLHIITTTNDPTVTGTVPLPITTTATSIRIATMAAMTAVRTDAAASRSILRRRGIKIDCGTEVRADACSVGGDHRNKRRRGCWRW